MKKLLNLFSLNGRARRIEYALMLIYAALASYLFYFFCFASLFGGREHFVFDAPARILIPLSGVLVLYPFLATAVRRHHDFGRSGWWALVCLLPIIGQIWMMVIAVIDTQPFDNIYGKNPKAQT